MTFFSEKRDWSRYKDQILSYYLTPYLTKIAKLRRPIVIFDCFGGAGKFEDGSAGSPLLISSAVMKAAQKGIKVKGVYSEPKQNLFEELNSLCTQFGELVEVYNEDFSKIIPRIINEASNSSIFVYLDPFGVKPLDFHLLEKIFALSKKTSVEVLINFNFVALVRNAEACITTQKGTNVTPSILVKKEVPEPELWETPISSRDIQTESSMTEDKLNSICGGDYWKPIALSNQTHPEKVYSCAKCYLDNLANYFGHVMFYEVKETPRSSVPKYHLLFLSDSYAAVELMNDNMCKARTKFLEDSYANDDLLMDLRSDEEKHDAGTLLDLVLGKLSYIENASRGEIIRQLITENFGQHERKHYRGAIEELIKNGQIYTSTGKKRINDSVLISFNPFGFNH